MNNDPKEMIGVARAQPCGCVMMIFVKDTQTDPDTLRDAAKMVKKGCSLEYFTEPRYKKLHGGLPFGCKKKLGLRACDMEGQAS